MGSWKNALARVPASGPSALVRGSWPQPDLVATGTVEIDGREAWLMVLRWPNEKHIGHLVLDGRLIHASLDATTPLGAVEAVIATAEEARADLIGGTLARGAA